MNRKKGKVAIVCICPECVGTGKSVIYRSPLLESFLIVVSFGIYLLFTQEKKCPRCNGEGLIIK